MTVQEQQEYRRSLQTQRVHDLTQEAWESLDRLYHQQGVPGIWAQALYHMRGSRKALQNREPDHHHTPYMLCLDYLQYRMELVRALTEPLD